MEKPTTFWQRLWHAWMRQPQNVWLRRAFFQIHLWSGLALGLYITAISISGSAIVFRNELYGKLFPGPTTVAVSGPRLTHDELKRAAHAAWPDYVVTFIWKARHENEAVEVWMERDGWKNQRLFDPYTGKDIGRSKPYSISVLAWLSDLHTNLLLGRTGRFYNGLISIAVTLLCISGLVIWWPGILRWRRSLLIDWRANWKRLNWDLHSAVGIWMFAFVFIWGFTGVYVCFPGQFNDFVQTFSPSPPQPQAELVAPAPSIIRVADTAAPQVKTATPASVVPDDQSTLAPPEPLRPQRPRRPRIQPKLSAGETVLRWFYYLHFGNFAGWPVKALWVVLGLSPILLFVTGTIMWWNRVLSREARATRRRSTERTTAVA
jgi:uncharacterized iron-regulated membrane protein